MVLIGNESTSRSLPPRGRTPPEVVVSGILFSRSVRSSFASFTVAPMSSTNNSSTIEHTQSQENSPFLVRLQFMDNIQELRSFCRKQYKIGDRIDFLRSDQGRWEKSSSSKMETTDRSLYGNTENLGMVRESWSQKPRWVVDLFSASEASTFVALRESRVWNMKDCQQYQIRYIPKKKQQQKQGTSKSRKSDKENKSEDSSASKSASSFLKDNDNNSRNDSHHGGGKEKRLQAQELINFFMSVIRSKIVANREELGKNGDDLVMSSQRGDIEQRVRDWFNRGDGVLDVAGGCGHVSMALGMNGILSTVVDARSSVGKLPGRDRKIWKRRLMNKPTRQRRERQVPNGELPKPITLVEFEYCKPVVEEPLAVPFKSQQAWFGSKPDGYDASFRHPEEEDIPLMIATAIPNHDIEDHDQRCSLENIDSSNRLDGDTFSTQKIEGSMSQPPSPSMTLRRQASALVALHPDEATGEIVQQAVKHRIPFVVVPCCVFARLFPHRKTKNGRGVSSYEDLLDFLQEQDPSIQRTKLSFGGKNHALWSTFPDG